MEKQTADYGGILSLLLTDFSKAFDCIPQELILRNWKHMVFKQKHLTCL